ncbi:TPA: hypothetical protein ACY4SK_001278 [Clostridium perfringens]
MHKMSKEEFLFRYKKDIELKKKKEEEIKQGIRDANNKGCLLFIVLDLIFWSLLLKLLF